MIVTVLYRASNSPDVSGMSNPFIDVPAQAYYYAPVVWAASNDIVRGDGLNCFLPDDYVSRQQLAVILCRFAAFNGNPFPRDALEDNPEALLAALTLRFADAGDIEDYARAPVYALVSKGVMLGGIDGKFNPNEYGTRAQTSAILRRYMTLAA